MPDYPVETVQKTGADSNRIDIVFLGDGYTASDIDTTYTQNIQSFLAYMFGNSSLTAPFGRYTNFFNIYRVDVVSAQSGADDPNAGITVNTALNASYRWDGVTDRLLYIDTNAASSVLNSALAGTGIHADMRFVTVNSTKYGGGGGYYSVFAGGNQSASEIALHELGHSFAHLADEYWTAGTTYSGSESTQPNITQDPTGAKWARWIGYNDPTLGTIGAYQGGDYCQFGIYRPSQNSKMQTLGKPFDAVAREQFILGFYSIVHPLDSYTANSTTLVDPTTLVADTIDPTIIRTCWTVDGTTFSDSNAESVSLANLNVASGYHTIQVLAYDPTDWVRSDSSSLKQQVSWSIELTHAVMRASAGHQSLVGGPGVDEMFGTDGADTLCGGGGNDTLDGGANVDIAVFAGHAAAYTISQGTTGVFVISGGDGTDTLTNIEYAKFDDQTMRLLPGSGTIINWAADPSTYLAGIRDFDGNDLGNASGWKLIGTADVNGDSTAEHIFVNRQNGRWAEVGTEADGKTYFANNGWAGDTRVVGIYIDPLVANGTVVLGSDFDSQRRFQNDLNIENIHGVLGQNDYNHDGLQEIYFSLTDGTAYLHAYMHADGNIQYANYQNQQQVKDYLTSNGFGSSTWAGWFPSSQTPLVAIAGG